MTEIPEHLLKRSRERRAAIDHRDDALVQPLVPQTDRWEMPPEVAAVIVSLGEKARDLSDREKEWVLRAQVTRAADINRRREALRELIADYEAKYGEITQEELLSVWEEPN